MTSLTEGDLDKKIQCPLLILWSEKGHSIACTTSGVWPSGVLRLEGGFAQLLAEGCKTCRVGQTRWLV
jgi:hypothetical protein